MLYPNGKTVHAGDSVRLCNGETGKVVISIDTDEYLKGFPKSDWPNLSAGVLVLTGNGALVAIDSNEDSDVIPAADS